VAQMQPESSRQTGKKEALSDVTYDIVTELSRCADAVDVLDEYIDDAREANDQQVVKIFEQLREDNVRACDMLRDLVKREVQQGKI
jgi:hypothetical protein